MKVLLLYDYPASPSGLATQGALLHKGLEDIGVEVHSVNCESPQEKEWYYRWFKPDAVVGIGYWGHTPDLILHPQQYGMQPVPWLVANGVEFTRAYRASHGLPTEPKKTAVLVHEELETQKSGDTGARKRSRHS